MSEFNYSVVGLSNILDNKFDRRKPTKRSHGKVVGAAIVNSKLCSKVMEGIERVAGVKSFLVFTVTTLYFAIVSGGIGADELVTDT